MASTGPHLDVAVIGDGPAGLALAAECARRGLSTTVIGPGEPWSSTYGMWVDDVESTLLGRELGETMFTSIAERVIVYGTRRHEVERRYGIVANARVRDHLLAAVDHRRARVEAVEEHAGGARLMTTDGLIRAGRVIDAAGLAGRADDPSIAWQTAYGVVLDSDRIARGSSMAAPATGRATGPAIETVFMDWRELPGAPDVGAPTFCYVVEVEGGWLVEETVLTAAPAIDPEALRPRLLARLATLGLAAGTEPLGAGRLEIVRIPMDMAPVTPTPLVETFGAAAGLTHPATGFSVAASWRFAEPVAAAIAAGRGIDSVIARRRLRSTRALYRYGARVIADLDADGLARFFDVFFDRPTAVWAPFLRLDTPPRAVARTMLSMFVAAPWSIRRALVRRPVRHRHGSRQVAGSFTETALPPAGR